MYIDAVTDYTSAAFIMCFDRLIAKHSQCKRLCSDNGTNFVGAYKELKKAFKQWHSPEVRDVVNAHGIDWKFITPAAPHQGGIWEAAVKQTKYHLRRLFGNKVYSYEHLITVLSKVAAVLNSRPLYALYDEPNDTLAITPSHLALGRQMVLPPPIASPPSTSNPIKSMRAEQQKLLEHFWQSWRKEYLTSLMQRKKWAKEREPPKLGQIVLVLDENT